MTPQFIDLIVCRFMEIFIGPEVVNERILRDTRPANTTITTEFVPVHHRRYYIEYIMLFHALIQSGGQGGPDHPWKIASAMRFP